MDLSTLDNLNFRLSIEDVTKASPEKQTEIKLACQTSLRFLSNCILRPSTTKKFPTLVERVHGKIIDAFPKCDPDTDILEWADLDEFVVLASRGMLKSTIGMAFLTQVILCSPDVRIMIISGKVDKSQSILDGARKPFLTNEVIRYLFPEWALEKENTSVEEFTTPKRNPELNYRDGTMTASSFDAVKAGWHGELILFDDATNEQNSNNMENCQKTHDRYDETDEMIEPNALRVFLGTKWHDEDLPEYIRKKGVEELEASGHQTCSYFVLPAWTLRTDGNPAELAKRLEREKNGSLIAPGKDGNDGDVILTWPEKLSAKFLFKIYRKNRPDFYKQYLLDASLEVQKSFTEEVLTRQFRPMSELEDIPIHDRAVIIHWDMASTYSGRRKKSESDYSCGIVVVFQRSTRRMYVVDAMMTHFVSGDDIANGVIRLFQSAMNFGPVVAFSMEDAVGVRNIESNISRIAKEIGLEQYRGVNFILPDNNPNAKNVNIAQLASAMTNGHVVVINTIPYAADIRVQFEKWSIDAKRRKDDGPDCIAQTYLHYYGMILPNSVESMQPDGPVLSWEPVAPPEAPDPHSDERENADIAYLAKDTTLFS